MIIQKNPSTISAILPTTGRTVASLKGNILVYLIVVILIFGVLGVTIVSLFTTATSSSATPNDARRAAYALESGMRYALSELRNSDFATATINRLNSTAYYTLDTGQSFSINVFGPWFDAASDQSFTSGGIISLTVPEGKIPSGFTIPNGLWVVNYDYLGARPSYTTARDPVTDFSKTGDTTLTITVSNGFAAAKDDRICLGVKPTETRTINEDGDIYVERPAKDFFPAKNGAININRVDYVYQRLVDDLGNNRVILKNISESSMPNSVAAFPLTVDNTDSGVYIGDFIVLSPRNHIVIPTGTSATVTVGGTLDDGINNYDTATAKSTRRKPDIEFAEEPNLDTSLTQKETNTGFINVDDIGKTVNIGGGGSTSDEFGSVWYNADITIGGKQNFCQAGECEFGLGVRAYFTLDYSGDGEGLTFALLNGALNNHTSSGGDIDLAELIGYAGDSRKVTNPGEGSDFLDGTGNGLRPPKIAMELDTRTDNANFEYCNPVASTNPADSQQNSRNDPLSADRDAIQYVYWGFDPTLAIACRGDDPSYDDNRHDSGEGEKNWKYPNVGTIGTVRSTPAVAEDGTVYVGSDDGHLYAVNPDGSLKWQSILIGAVHSSPAVGLGGVVYVGSDDGNVYAFQPDSASPNPPLYSFSTGGNVWTSPVIGTGGKVYVGSNEGIFYGFTPDLTKEWEFTAAGPISFGRPAVDLDGVLYISHRSNSNGRVYALNPAQRELPTPPVFPAEKEWSFNIGDGNDYMPGIDPSTGIIYSDRSGNRMVAIDKNVVVGTVDATNFKWEFLNGSDIDSTPVVGEDGIVYFGDDNNKLFAINPADREAEFIGSTLTTREWAFVTGGDVDNTPAIAPDGTILVVSNDGNLYAVNPDGTEKWTFPIPVDPVDGGLPNSSPTVLSNASIYVGSSEGRLYSINDIAIPRNIKDKMITSINDGSDIRVGDEVVTVNNEENWLQGSTTKGPWAIRTEIMRSDTTIANGNYEYTLHSWTRQCNAIDCSDVLGTFYQDTRIEYNTTSQRTVHLEQTVELIPADHTQFDRFLFGFTGAIEATDDQSALINNFQLSFIRPNDPFILTDEDWPTP